MGKLVLISTLFLNLLFSESKTSIYNLNCIGCHKRIPVSIDKYFYRYLLKYSSEKDVKNALVEYLKNPKKENSVMPEAFLKRFGVKKKSNLSDKKLRIAIDSYWNIYQVFGKLE